MSEDLTAGSVRPQAAELPTERVILSVEDLTIGIGSRANRALGTRGVDFSVRSGSRVGIVGESGSGKSLTTLAIMGLLPKAATVVRGAIRYHDRDLLQFCERQWRTVRGKEIALVFQNALSALNPLVRIGDQLADAIQAHRRLPRQQAWGMAVEILGQMGIPDPENRAKAFPHQYSGGMAQRAMIGLALAAEPHLVLADEPTTGLDPLIEAQVLELLVERTTARGQTLVLVSHDMAAIARVSTHVVVMYAGEVLEEGPAGAVLHQPASPYTHALLESSMLRRGAAFRYIAGGAPHLPPDYGGCVFAGRCWREQALGSPEICRAQRPARRALAPGHFVRCHFVTGEEAGSLGHGGRAQAGGAPRAGVARATPLLRADRISRSYEVRQSALRRVRVEALTDVSLSVHQGEIIGVIGESGSGKSTLGRVLVGLESPNDGGLYFGDRPVQRLGRLERREFRRSIQMVFQNPYRSFNPMLPIATSVGEALRFARHTGADAGRSVSDLLTLVGLDARYGKRYPRELSGGELQRAAIARALATGPRVIFLDEPTSALDASVRGQVITVLLQLRSTTQLALILVSHELEVVRALADQVLVLFRGQVVEEGPLEAVLGAALHPYTRALVVGEGLDAGDGRVGQWMVGATQETHTAGPGCRYAARCPFATDRCRSEPQRLEEQVQGHRVRCWRAAEIMAAGAAGVLGRLRTDSALGA